MKKLTETQEKLLNAINKHKKNINEKGVFEYDEMKEKCSDFKSFDTSFNALLHKGHVLHFQSNRNTFITKI